MAPLAVGPTYSWFLQSFGALNKPVLNRPLQVMFTAKGLEGLTVISAGSTVSVVGGVLYPWGVEM